MSTSIATAGPTLFLVAGMSMAIGMMACVTNNAAEILSRALNLAAAGDPASLEWCQRLEVGDNRGLCKIEASKLQPDRGAVCDGIVLDNWRAECWFVYAEDLAVEKRWGEAVEACKKATRYDGDCSRHLWWESQVAGDEAATALVVVAFPDAAKVLDLDAPDDTTASRPAVFPTRRALLEDQRAKRSTQTSLAAQGWVKHFLHTATIDPSTCPPDAGSECVQAARHVFSERWQKAVARPASRDALCAGEESMVTRLQSGGHPELLAVLADLRTELCEPAAGGQEATPLP